MAGAGPTPGYSTVTMLSSGWVRPIGWDELAPGDFVGALGPGTAGDAGHVMVVVAVDHPGGTYTVLEQAGYGPGPDRNTYRLGDGQGRTYLPYRLTDLEDEMSTRQDQARQALVVLYGATDEGWETADSVAPVAANVIKQHNLAAVEARLAKQISDGFAALGQAIAAAGGITPAGLNELLEQVSAAAEHGAEQGAADALDGATITIHTEAGQ